ncbi:nuclear pore protein-like protein [Colletotrichum asianum]|uniref:Nuclear pore protein-like protein n=1 Tax=Colletotrichum asianum TaxID=702518 RepID=A0A8H3ZLJ8_9PEZI|nr:nuclear pore protein-like protein [Colletotrichum asianum]
MIEGVSHKLDPNGDVLLTLHPSTSPFAPWDERASAATEGKGERLTSPNGKLPDVHVTSKAESIKYLLSSRHLALASRYFASTLKWTGKEASTGKMDGPHHVDASGWDSQAFLVVMKAMHGKFRGISRCVDLEMLAKVAAIVDYYDCHESLEPLSTIWIEMLSRASPLPKTCDRDLLLWLLVSFGLLPSLDRLPIRSSITDAIDQRREDIIERILKMLENQAERFRNGSSGCKFECSATLLGLLVKNMAEHRLSHPTPSQPYTGYSVTGLERSIRAFKYPPSCCPLSPFIVPARIEKYDNITAGLEMKEFLGDEDIAAS